MRAYYHITEGESNKTGYRIRLENYWRIHHSDLKLSAQRLSDQVRSIVERKVLSDAELENRKQGIVSEDRSRPGSPIEGETEEERQTPLTEHPMPHEGQHRVDSMYAEIDLKYRGIPLEERPKIPKLRPNWQLAIGQMVLTANTELSEICHAVYCAVMTICAIHKVKLLPTQRKPDTTPDKPPWELCLEKRINTVRTEISILYKYLHSSNVTRRVK